MRRPLAYLSLLLVLAAAAPVLAGLSSSDRKTLKREAGRWLDPNEDDGVRDESRQKFKKIFQKKAKELKDVKTLSEILADAGARKVRHRGIESIEIESQFPETSGQKFKYLLSVPRKYKPDGPSWPLIYAIPEKDQKPKDYLDKYWQNPAIRDSNILVVLDFNYSDVETIEKEMKKDEDGVITMVDKKVKSPFTWDNIRAQAEFWETLLNVMVVQCKVDPNRIILDGAGLGSTGTLEMVVGQPWRFAGLILRGGEYEGDNLKNLKNLKVLSLPHPTASDKARKTAEALKEICGANFTEGSNDPKWSGSAEEGTEMLAWLTGAARNRYPLPMTWTYLEDTDEIGYWCRIAERIDAKKPASISIESKKDVVTIKTENVKLFDLYLNDLLVDLDEPFELRVNDEKPRSVEVTRDADEVLRHAFAGGGKLPHDPGCVFVAELTNVEVAPPGESGEKKEGGGKDGGKKKDGK